MKKLIYSNDVAITAHTKQVHSLCSNLNAAIDSLHQCQPFVRIESGDQAFEYVSDPIAHYDNIIITETKTKRIPGLKIDVSIICQMYGLNRQSFVNSVKSIRLAPAQKHLFSWQDGKFEVNQGALTEDCDQFCTYAETLDQLEILQLWESMRDILNQHIDREFISGVFAGQQIAQSTGLRFEKGRFELDGKKLAYLIKNGKAERIIC
ncbi:MAG: hypothetical protein R6W78_10460 [Bacteroidales bacterium]